MWLTKTIFFYGLYIKHSNLKELMGDINASWKAPFVALITQTAAFPISLIYLLTVALPIIYPFFLISVQFSFPPKNQHHRKRVHLINHVLFRADKISDQKRSWLKALQLTVLIIN